jgi:hypothetical protein
MKRALVIFGAALGLACSTGEGEGEVKSDRLFIEDCWNGPFDLEPSFFGAEPAADSLIIRVQRGDNYEEVSDGLLVLIKDVDEIREASLGGSLRVGLPPGVSPPGVPVVYDPNPPKVSLALYLNATCHSQNGTIYAVDGNVSFESLFSGDPNEDDAEDRLTDAAFDATFTDPRDIGADGSYDAAHASVVRGWFRFYFQRGQPAQPFP